MPAMSIRFFCLPENKSVKFVICSKIVLDLSTECVYNVDKIISGYLMRLEIRGAEKLSLREKQVATYKEMGLASAEIAKRLKMAQSTVATLYARARAKGYEAVIVVPGEALGLFTEEDGHFDEEKNS